MGQVTAQVEGRARAGEYLLAPAFAPEQWDVISVECTNPTMVSWMMVNHSSRDLTWSHGSYLGALQEPGEILVPSHRCQGDTIGYGGANDFFFWENPDFKIAQNQPQRLGK